MFLVLPINKKKKYKCVGLCHDYKLPGRRGSIKDWWCKKWHLEHIHVMFHCNLSMYRSYPSNDQSNPNECCGGSDLNLVELKLKDNKQQTRMPIFSATLGSFTSISSSFLSQSHLSPFVKTPCQWQHHYHTAKVLVSASGNTQIDQNPDSGLLQRPTPPDPLDDARQARVLSFLFLLLYFSFLVIIFIHAMLAHSYSYSYHITNL